MATVKSYVDEYKKLYGGDYEKQVAERNAIYDNQIAALKAINDGVLNDANAQYDELERQNEISKYINAEKVAENNANLGLTKSGLNLTQQTAVQLSAANNSASIARQRQSMVDKLAREVAASEAQINAERATDLLNMQQNFNNKAESYGVSMHNADLQAETERIKNQQNTTAALQEQNKKDWGSIIKKYVDNGDFATAYKYFDAAGGLLGITEADAIAFLTDYAKLDDEEIDEILGNNPMNQKIQHAVNSVVSGLQAMMGKLKK